MLYPPPRSTRTVTHFPYPALFRSGQQFRVDLCQQPAAQSLAAIGPPLSAGRITATAVHLCQPCIAGRVVGPGRAWGLGAIGVIEAGRVEEVTRSDPGDRKSTRLNSSH